MGELLALSFDQVASPSIRLTPLRQATRSHAQRRGFGWGIGWYPGEENAADTMRDPTSLGDDPMAEALADWSRFRSTIFLAHIRNAARRISHRDTHPFIRSYGGRSWLFAHDGTLSDDVATLLPLGTAPTFEPLGKTDSEHAFCWMLTGFQRRGARRLRDMNWDTLHRTLSDLNRHGTLNMLLSDGEDLVVYHDQAQHHGLYWLRKVPPEGFGHLQSDVMDVQLNGAGNGNRSALVFSSRPLSGEAWVEMAGGQMLVACRGDIVWDSLSVWDRRPPAVSLPAPVAPPQRSQMPVQAPVAATRMLAPDEIPELLPSGEIMLGSHGMQPLSGYGGIHPETPSRVMTVTHQTTYRYTTAVETSTHVFRLMPLHDRMQSVLDHAMDVSVDGVGQEYEDVFGNWTTFYTIDRPYTELSVIARSTVRVFAHLSMDPTSHTVRERLPLVWMPWQRQMMLPYLLPPELPESELRELNDFAMSFAVRNDHELLETLLDMNRVIHRDFSYVSGSTNLETTPYEVYVDRRGVCQDFANLMICMARLLNVPARYRSGYIYTGADHNLSIQSEASHAWAEFFLPSIGWCGLDPTNGVATALDHIRVACGRNYRDATPTTGTIYKGSGGETLDIAVRVDIVQDEANEPTR